MSGPPVLGLGCSRFGSLSGGVDRVGAARLVGTALDIGIRHFDTADIYGQGDSERMLGELLRGRTDTTIATKIGQRFPPAVRIALMAKPLLRPLLARLPRTDAAASRARAGLLPQDFGAQWLRTAAEGSLRRMGRETFDQLLLHSPSGDVLRRGDAMGTLETLRTEGKARIIGVSIDDADALAAALEDSRVEAIQMPIAIASTHPALVERAAGRILIAREIVAGKPLLPAVDALVEAARSPFALALLGTGSPDHLRQAQAIFTQYADSRPPC